MASCSFGCLDSSGSDLGGMDKDKSDITEPSAYEIPELSQTPAVPEVSANSVYTELKVNPYKRRTQTVWLESLIMLIPHNSTVVKQLGYMTINLYNIN